MAKEYRYLINGMWRTSTDRVEVINPYDGKAIGLTYNAGDIDIEDAINASQESFENTKKLPAYRRAEIIDGVVYGLKERADEIARIITQESGKPINDSRMEVKRAICTFQIACEETKRLGGKEVPLDIIAGSEKRMGIVRRFPVGPILGITPFNFPLNLVAHKVAPAMAVGSPIMLKPAPRTPLSALILGEIVTAAGWPAGGLNIFLCSNQKAELLVRDERIRMMTFTGSAIIGWMLNDMAGKKRVTLELGGNAGVLVHHSADVKFAAMRCALGAFSLAGQSCISVQRIFVHRDLYRTFLERFLNAISDLKMGDPMDELTKIGPMIDEDAAKRAEEWVDEAIRGGARLIVGGKRKENFFEPTVITDTKPDMKLSSEEVFAPIVTVEQYEGFEEAVSKINDSRYGLQAGIFTTDINEIFYAFNELEVGGVVVNDVPTYRVDNMPYGGVKTSGLGREGVRYAMEEMTELKLLVLNIS
ncbi:MAG: aldehyde dehydrogenase family protein [Thermodesulfobacteriota bacterium]